MQACISAAGRGLSGDALAAHVGRCAAQHHHEVVTAYAGAPSSHLPPAAVILSDEESPTSVFHFYANKILHYWEVGGATTSMVLLVIFPWVFLWLFSGLLLSLVRFMQFQYHMALIAIDAVLLSFLFLLIHIEDCVFRLAELCWRTAVGPLLQGAYRCIAPKQVRDSCARRKEASKSLMRVCPSGSRSAQPRAALKEVGECEKQNWGVENPSRVVDPEKLLNAEDESKSGLGCVIAATTPTQSCDEHQEQIEQLFQDVLRENAANSNAGAATSTPSIRELCAKLHPYFVRRPGGHGELSSSHNSLLGQCLDRLISIHLQRMAVPISSAPGGGRGGLIKVLSRSGTPSICRDRGCAAGSSGVRPDEDAAEGGCELLEDDGDSVPGSVLRHRSQSQHQFDFDPTESPREAASLQRRRQNSSDDLLRDGEGSFAAVAANKRGSRKYSAGQVSTTVAASTTLFGDVGASRSTGGAAFSTLSCASSFDPRRRHHLTENEELLEWLLARKRSLGVTALCLSGGGSLAMIHFGLIKHLLECEKQQDSRGRFRGFLPSIISGVSGGSIVAGFLAYFTDDELLAEICVPGLSHRHKPHRFFPPVWRQVVNFFRTGNLVDSADFDATLTAYFGDVTFAEAYARTGRNVSIWISSNFSKEMPRCVMLNHITTPRVTLASAIATSCAAPGIMQPRGLMEKVNAVGVVASSLTELQDESEGSGGAGEGELPGAESATREGSSCSSSCTDHSTSWGEDASPLTTVEQGQTGLAAGAAPAHPDGSGRGHEAKSATAAPVEATISSPAKIGASVAATSTGSIGTAGVSASSTASAPATRLAPFHALGRLFWDGSLTAEVPKDYLRSCFGVTQFIVSQANPHVAPLLQLHQRKKKSILANLHILIAQDLQRRTRILSDLNCIPAFFGRQVRGVMGAAMQNWTETKDGITLFPCDQMGLASSIKEAVTNPTPEDMARYFAMGKRMAEERERDLAAMLEAEYSVRSAIVRLTAAGGGGAAEVDPAGGVE